MVYPVLAIGAATVVTFKYAKNSEDNRLHILMYIYSAIMGIVQAEALSINVLCTLHEGFRPFTVDSSTVYL